MKKIVLTLSLAILTAISFAQNLTKYDKDGKYGWKDENGKKVIIKAQYEEAGNFDNTSGLVTVKLDGKYGMIDKTGKTVLPFEFEKLKAQEKGLFSATKGGKVGFIDKDGKEVLPFKYDLVQGSPYSEVYFVKLNGKWGMLSLDLKELNEIKYDVIRGPIGMNPYVYKATRDGQDFRLDANGQEEAAIETPTNDANGGTKKGETANEKHKFTCGGCGAIEITESSNKRPSPNKTKCTNPKVNNSTSHSWDYTGKVK